jgi:hypothetical protein
MVWWYQQIVSPKHGAFNLLGELGSTISPGTLCLVCDIKGFGIHP